MSVTIRTLPNVIFSRCDMRFTAAITVAATEGRITERAAIGEEGLWRLSATAAPLGRADGALIDQLEVFAEACARQDVFEAVDLTRQRPRAYESPINDGVGRIQGISAGGDFVTVAGLGGGLIINRGSLIEFRNATNNLVRCLCRVAGDVTTTAGGGAAVALLNPVNRTVFSAGDEVIIERPSTLMQIDSYVLPKDWDKTVFSFDASEVMFS